MSALDRYFQHDPTQLLVPLVVLVATLIVGRLIKLLLFKGLRKWAARSPSPAATTITEAINRPFMIWVVILALHLAAQSSELPARWTGDIAKVLLILWILSLALMGSRLARDLIRFYGRDIPGAMPVTTLTQNLAQIGVCLLALLVLLNLLDIPITPILTALGVGGLAVALALQDTLSNLFAGFYIAIARQVRLHDYIKLNTGEEGYVTDITWRSTMIRTLNGNLTIIPNAKLAQAIVTNYYLPEKRLSASLQVSVSYAADVDRVESVILEEARRAIGSIPAMLGDPPPSVRFEPGFGESSLGFTLSFQVAEFADQFVVRHEMRKRIIKRFRQEGIELALPARAVYVKEHKAE